MTRFDFGGFVLVNKDKILLFPLLRELMVNFVQINSD